MSRVKLFKAVKAGIETTEEWQQAQHAARQLDAVADSIPGWMRDACGIDEVIFALYDQEDPNEGEET